MTNFSSLRVGFSGLLLAGGLAAAGTASALVLDTADNKANATLQLSSGAQSLLSRSNTHLTAMGNATSSVKGTYVLPVTEAEIGIGFFKLNPIAGEAMNSALRIDRGSNGNVFGIGNFTLDFAKNYVYADVFLNGQTSNQALFSFKEKSDLKLGLSGLNLSLYNTLGDLTLTTGGAATFASALNLSTALAKDFAATNWGTIKVDITTARRNPAVPTGPFTAAQLVPEPSTYAMMGLGLVGIGFMARRKARAA